MSDTTTSLAQGGDPATRKARPLSPHLSIYKPIPTMVMSILHRFTGAALYFGTFLVVWWLLALASGPDAYARVEWFFGSVVGLIVLAGYTFVLVHHALGGLKHLVQDTSAALGKAETTTMALAQPVVALLLTVAIWVAALLIA